MGRHLVYTLHVDTTRKGELRVWLFTWNLRPKSLWKFISCGEYVPITTGVSSGLTLPSSDTLRPRCYEVSSVRPDSSGVLRSYRPLYISFGTPKNKNVETYPLFIQAEVNIAMYMGRSGGGRTAVYTEIPDKE